MIKKVVMVCIIVMLVTVVAGVAGSIQISSASNPSTASVPKNLQFQSYNGPFVGSKNSNVYHYPWCYEAQKIHSENLVTFATVADACAAGYRPCLVCKPPACGQVGTTLSLSASNPSPAVSEWYTLSGYLHDSTGKALAYKPIDIWVRHDGDSGILWKTITTDSNGKYSTAASSIKKAYIRTVFKGDSSYAGSKSNLVTVIPRLGTTLTLTASITSPLSGQSYTLSGYLKDSTGRALANKQIDIWYRHAGETTGHLWKTMYTGNDGKYSTTAVSTQAVYLRTVFKGDSFYLGSRSSLMIVNLI